MTIEEMLAADLAATAFDTGAAECPSVPVIWTDPDDGTVSADVLMILGAVERSSEENESGRFEHLSRTATVMKTGDGSIASPKVNATVTIDSEIWQVARLIEDRRVTCRLELVRVIDLTRQRQGHTSRIIDMK